jgi:predicted TIM-barrel fold metal-dependent hydrolase
MKPHSTRIDRRTFCGAAAAVAISAALPSAKGEAAPKRGGGKYIDMHTHIGQCWNHTRELTVDGLLQWMNEHEVARAVVMPVVSPEASTYPLTPDFVLAQTKAHRDRMIPFCVVDPRTSYSGERHGLKFILNRYAEQGAKGFGEHKPGVPIDHPGSMELYAVCGELNLPVLFHLDDQRNTDEAGLPGLERVLKANPKTTFIGHGPGWWASISGGISTPDLGAYPKGPVAPGGAIDRLMEKYPNLYGELSADSGAGAISRDAKFGRDFLVRRQDRIMFGTDYLSPGQKVPQFEVLAQIQVPDEVRAKVFMGNSKRLLRLED